MLRRPWKPSLLLALFVVALLLAAPAARGEPDDLTIEPTEFGLAFVNSAEQLRSTTRIQRGVNAGAKLDRFPLYWDKVEPTAGQFDWSRQDAALRANEQQGLGTLAILLGTAPPYFPRDGDGAPVVPMPRVGGGPVGVEGEGLPPASPEAEANGCTIQGTPPARNLYEPIFADGSDEPAPGKAVNPNNFWARFVWEAVRRYRPGGTAGLNVRYWEIWNEADLCHFWGGTVDEYARLLKVAFLVIKSVDAEATVMWGGLALYGPKYEGGRHFLNELAARLRADPMAAAHGGFFDAAAVHQYSNVTHGYRYTRLVRTALAGTGWQNKPVWVTESGVPICGDWPGPSCPSPYRANPVEQASYIWQNVAYTRIAANNGPIFHFQLHDDGGNECRQEPPADGFGLVTNEPDAECVPHQAVPRLAYRAYQLAAQFFPDTELLWADIQDERVRRVAFYHPATRERRLLVWAIGGADAVADVPAAGSTARRIALDGSEVTLTPANGSYQIAVSRATNQNQPNSSTYTIGGVPYLLVERDTLPPAATIAELPPVSPPSFEVAWEASDLGSGIVAGSVEVWVQADEGAWARWLAGQPAGGDAIFTGEAGVRYRFGVLATDRAGNAATTPVALAETRVTDGSQLVSVSGQVLDMRGAPAPWAFVQVGPGAGFADGSGRFRFAVPLGRWDVAVQGTTITRGWLLLADTTLTLLLPPVTNPIHNGDFEAGLDGWTQGGSSPLATEALRPTFYDHALHLATGFVPSPGVPGTEGSAGGNSTLEQRVTVPPGAPTLALVYKVDSAETDGGNGSCANPAALHDKFEIIVVGPSNQPDYVHCQETASGWRYQFLDLSAYAGQPVRLIFNVYESSPNRRTSAWVDHLFLGASPVLEAPRATYLPLLVR